MRRQKIKVAANLSVTRRNVNRGNAETQLSLKQNDLEKPQQSNVNIESERIATEVSDINLPTKSIQTPDESPHVDDINKVAECDREINEKCLEVDPAGPVKPEKKLSFQFEQPAPSQDESSTFKTPLQMPRSENDSSGASSSSQSISGNKFRRLKMAPRLNASRNVPKNAEMDDAIKKSEDNAVEPTHLNTEQDLSPDFAPPTPTRSRPETPREATEAPTFIINHNIQHSGAPPSPFPYHSHGHSRNRTESLCSMKSNRDIVTVANLQPRKNIRTEDQKIIDIKRESRERLLNKDLDKSKLRMFDMIYFNPQNNPMKPRSPHKQEKPKKVEIVEETPPVSPVKKEAVAMPVPQLRLNANGDMVLDETSLVVENEQQKQNRILLASTNVVYDDDYSGNYGYYKRQQRTREWPEEETVKFYRCLNTVGTDFSLMLNLFPNRSRRDLKLKFKKEERNNPQLIDKALLKHNTFDLDELQRELNQEEEDRRKEAESKSNSVVKEQIKRKILKRQEAKIKAQQHAKTKIEKILTDGELAMNIVNMEADVKENLGMSASTSGVMKKKRQYKKKVKVDGDGEVVQEIVLDPTQEFHVLEGFPTDVPLEALIVKPVRKSRKKNHVMTGLEQKGDFEPPVKKPRRSLKKMVEEQDKLFNMEIDNDLSKLEFQFEASPVAERPDLSQLTQRDVSFNQEPLSINEATSELTDEATSKLKNEATSKLTDETTSASSNMVDEEKLKNMPIVATLSSDVANDFLYGESSKNIDCEVSEAPEISEAVIDDTFEVNTEPELFNVVDINTETTLTEKNSTKVPNISATTAEYAFEVPTIEPEPEPEPKANQATELHVVPEKKGKSRKKKFKPTLVSRLKLDANGEMVLDESSIETQNPIVEKPEAELIEKLETPAMLSCVESSETIQAIESDFVEIPVDENLNETKAEPTIEFQVIPAMMLDDDQKPSTSSAPNTSEAFDPEAFLDSLDMEKLVIVEAQRDGKDVYEIHEIDPVTQEICDEPLDLPPRYADLIIKLMTQEDGDE